MKPVSTNKAPAAIGPYSQAIEAEGFIFCSGQIALDPATGEITGDTAAKQVAQVFKNLKGILDACDCTLNNVLKTTVYITDMKEFAAVNEVYARFFQDHKPARACVEVSRLPKDALVEVECIAKKN